MSDEFKNRILERIKKYEVKCEKERVGPQRKNKKPEEEVIKAHLDYYSSHGFFVNRYESKAKLQHGVWRSSGLEFGTPDLLGSCPKGFFHAVEAKAQGRLSTLRQGQREFLHHVIQCNGFALCSDSLDRTTGAYTNWLRLGRVERREYLLSLLP